MFLTDSLSKNSWGKNVPLQARGDDGIGSSTNDGGLIKRQIAKSSVRIAYLGIICMLCAADKHLPTPLFLVS